MLNLLNLLLQADRVKTIASRSLYGYLNHILKNVAEVRFLNYGYVPEQSVWLPLEPADEPDRIHIQLYHAVVSAIDLMGKVVVEVSCGRGGGATFIKRYLKPRVMLGVDWSARAIDFCRRHHRMEGLDFLCGDAQRLPFAKNSFDALINVEASHNYQPFGRFLAEVRRVLKPGGYFLYADFRQADTDAAWQDQLYRSGLEVVEEKDIRLDVLRGLEGNTARNLDLVRKHSPRLLSSFFNKFAGVKGSMVFEDLRTGKLCYRRFVLRKPVEV